MKEPFENGKMPNSEQPPLEPTKTSGTAPPDHEDSVLGDMLNAMGLSFRKKKKPQQGTDGSSNDEPPEQLTSRAPEDHVSMNDDDSSDSSDNDHSTLASDPADILDDHKGSQKESFADEAEHALPHGSVDGEDTPDDSDLDFGEDAPPLSRSGSPSSRNKAANRAKLRRVSIIVSVLILILAGGVYLYPSLTEPRPPSEDVVATYADKAVTVEDLMNFIGLEGLKEREHMICEVHGFDHSKCDQLEECEQHPIDSIEGYRQMAQMLVMEQIILSWAEKNGISQREDVQHGLSDLLNDANVTQFMDQIHETQITPESIPKWEVQQYYDENRDQYEGKAFSEVEGEIRQLLIAQKDEEYFPEYIEELKQSAGLEVNFDLLRVTEPTDKEISAYYQTNIKDYQTEAAAEIQEIRISSSDKAREATTQLGAGESFENVAASFSDTGKADKVTIRKGSRDKEFEDAVWRLQNNEVSKAITNSDGTVSIVRLVKRTDAGSRPLTEVRETIKALLTLDNMEREYSVNKGKALFSIHSKRYTLGDFYTEFKELPLEYQQMFATFDTKKMLLEQYITKELLLEESTDTTMTDREQHDLEDLRVQYLSQILHQEEIDGQLEDPSDEEIEQFYKKNMKLMVTPASAKISLIWLSQGQNGELREQARKRADEALSTIRSGTDFAEAAKSYSEDYTKDSGGVIDEWLYEDHMPPELAKAVFSLSPGQVSEVTDSMGGFYIVRLDEKKDAAQNTLEESREAIRTHLKEVKHAELEKGMEAKLLEQYDLVVYEKTLRRVLKQQEATA